MAERDGTIVIDTQIDTKGVDAGSEKTEASLRRMAQKVNDIGATAKAALNKQIDAFARLNSQYDSQSEKIDALKRKIAGYSDEYGEMQAKIDETVKKLNDLEMMQGVIKDAVKDSAKRGTTFDTTQYKWVQEDIEKLTKEIEVAEREQDKLFATGNPFELGSKARAAKEDLEKLSQEEGKLADMHNKLQTAYDGVNDKINEYSQKADEATASTSRLSRIGGMVGKAIGSIATFGKNAAKSLTGAKKSSSGFGLSLGTLVKYGFGIRSLYVLVNKLRSALVDGFKNLSQYSGETNGSISMLWSSLERLKNSLATAFAPILTVVAPILSKFIDMLSTAASYVSMFFSFLSGKSTYTRAIAVQKNYAASLGDTASAAKDAADAISLPHWLEKLTGFSSVGFNVGYWSAPMVPYLAQGAVIPPNKEFMAVLGDQKSGNNIEAPESLIRRIVREESGNGKGSTYNVTAQVNRRTLFDLVLEEGKVRRTVTGRNPFETV